MQVPISPGKAVFVPLRVHGDLGIRETDALLDTGSTYVASPVADAVSLGYSLDAAPKVTAATANGPIEAPRITLSRVELGEFVETDVAAICLDVPGSEIRSLLGLSLLSRFRVVLDPEDKTLTITRP